MKSRNQKSCAITFGIIAFSFLCCPCRADWITAAEFSEKAGIDSIERFLVIPDIDTNVVLGFRIETLGDITGDSISDILIQRHSSSSWDDRKALLFYGGNPPDTIFDGVNDSLKVHFKNIGDINDDGYDDIGTLKYYTIGHSDVEFYFGGPDMDDSADFVIPDMISFFPRAADLDNDGELDIALSVDLNDSTVVNIYSIGQSRDTIPEYAVRHTIKGFGNNLATGDFNGDVHPDLAIATYLGHDSCFIKFYWGGPDFDTVPDFEIYSFSSMFGQILLPLGDFNGDGYGDIFISGANNDPFGVYYGGPDIDNEIDIITNKPKVGSLHYPPNSADVAGDVNNDGYPDLITGYTNNIAFYYEIRVFLGGPDAHSIPDVYIENLHIPGGQIDFGDEVAGIGDFNGDGIDDFAVRSRTQSGCCWRGEVNFFAGWNSHPTDVEFDYRPTLPQEFKLNNNYPNPFNPTTIISFELQHRTDVKLTIYNILGEEITTLLDRKLPAGSYEITWNGRDNLGQLMSTGVYIYQFKAEQFYDSKKMILLK